MISILLATTGRPDAVTAFLQSLAATTEGHRIEVAAAVDADPETIKRLIPPSTHVQLAVTYSREYRGCSKAWNDALALSTGDPVVLAADDLEFQPGWLDAALKKLAEFPDGWGLVGFNDGHWGSELSTHYLMSRRFVTEVLGGVVAWEAYQHSFNDREANARAQAADRYAWCEDAHVHHRHWLFGERPQDPTDTRLLGQHPESAQRFEERQAAGWPAEQEPVI